MKKNFVKPSLLKIFFARLFDLFVTSIFIIINCIFIKVNSYTTAIEFVSITLIIYIFFLILIPSIFKKRTFGKLIFGIYLLYQETKKPISFRILLTREVYFILIPYLCDMFCQFVRAFISTQYGEAYNNYGFIFSNIGNLFYALWMIYVCLTIKMQDNNLCIIDMKYKCGVYILQDEKEETSEEINKVDDFPGIISKEELNKIKEIDYKDVVDKNEK